MFTQKPVHSSLSRNCPPLESNQVSINSGLAQQVGEHPYHEIPLNSEKEGTVLIHTSLNGSQGHHAE